MIKEHARFQLEASKLGRNIVFQVTVYAKTSRRKTSLHAETQCSDPYHFVIQFVIKGCDSTEEIVERFAQQLRHRGFKPERMRGWAEKNWDQWTVVPEDSQSVA